MERKAALVVVVLPPARQRISCSREERFSPRQPGREMASLHRRNLESTTAIGARGTFLTFPTGYKHALCAVLFPFRIQAAHTRIYEGPFFEAGKCTSKRRPVCLATIRESRSTADNRKDILRGHTSEHYRFKLNSYMALSSTFFLD